jgi:hypothetical protein
LKRETKTTTRPNRWILASKADCGLEPAGAEEQLKTAKKQEPKKAKTLKRFTFDAGNSNTGVAGLVVSVKAYSKKQAVRLANAYLTSFKEPIDLPVPAGYKDTGVSYAMFCIGANLTVGDIDPEDIAEID